MEWKTVITIILGSSVLDTILNKTTSWLHGSYN